MDIDEPAGYDEDEFNEEIYDGNADGGNEDVAPRADEAD